ncbi:MAG TPA: M20 family metallopeptidase [Actinomycetota bacterium]|nr:M20 family metallopeptidase [Actinomycetota bacterium]
MTPEELEAVRREVQASFSDYLEALRELVGIDSGTYSPAGVNAVADRLQDWFEGSGWRVERVRHRPGPGEPQLGDLLVATLEAGSVGRVLLVGHMDTVFPDGTAAERPFRVEDGRALGPGVSDMKGGLLGGLFAVEAARRAGALGFGSVTFVCNPDEEIGSPFSGPWILQRARGADACFVLEAARENGDLVSARKGVLDLRVVYRGRAAHAGVEPHRGRSATLQAAHATVALHALNGRWPGVTVNVGVIRGGTRPNVVADRCELEVDVRAPTAELFERALAEVERVARNTTVPDVSVEVVRRSGFPPMERTEGTARLAERARRLAEALGFEVQDTATGGASDANAVSALGVPTLDGLGPVGGGAHSPEEWLDLESVVPRVSLLAGLLAQGP